MIVENPIYVPLMSEDDNARYYMKKHKCKFTLDEFMEFCNLKTEDDIKNWIAKKAA